MIRARLVLQGDVVLLAGTLDELVEDTEMLQIAGGTGYAIVLQCVSTKVRLRCAAGLPYFYIFFCSGGVNNLAPPYAGLREETATLQTISVHVGTYFSNRRLSSICAHLSGWWFRYFFVGPPPPPKFNVDFFLSRRGSGQGRLASTAQFDFNIKSGGRRGAPGGIHDNTRATTGSNTKR